MKHGIVQFAAFLLLAFLASAAADDKEYNINDFKRSYFKIIKLNNGFYKVITGLEKLKDEQPLLYGYIDKDFYTDIVTISRDRKTTNFYFYNDAEGVFDHKFSGPALNSDERIVSAKLVVAASTATYPDVVFITENTSDFSITMRVYRINYTAGQGYKLTEVPSFKIEAKNTTGKHQEPINFQVFEGKVVNDYWLLTDNNERKLVTFNRDSQTVNVKPFADVVDTSCDGCLSLDKIKGRTINSIGTNAFIDLDRDCRADLVLESADSRGNRALEIFIFNASGKFGLKSIANIDANLSIGTFVDVNQDNAVDLVFWDKDSQKLVVYFSKLEGQDKLSASTQCLESGLPFSFPSLDSKEDKRYVSTQDLIAGAQIVENEDLRIFPMARFVDVDIDGFMDLLINLKVDGKSDVYLFKNSPCLTGDKSQGENGPAAPASSNPLLIPACRLFVRETDTEKLGILQNKGSIQASAFDFGERG